jgi:small subunit ribosomal protein S8
MITDPIADFLVRLQNASMARKTEVSVPFSKMKRAVAHILAREGYVADVDEKSKKSNTLTVALSYKNGRPAINGVKRLSKPGRRLYMGVRDVRPVRRGHGLLVLSTPQGILTGLEAKQKRVGGEVLFEIW